MVIANHRPVFKTDAIIEKYSKKDGVPVKYVCTTDLKASDCPIDVFYRESPHPQFGNRYFGIFYDHYRGQSYILDADIVEDLEFGMIEVDGEYHYSQSHHDFVSVGGKVIDGGRAYARGNGYVMMKIKDGEFVGVQ